MRRVILRHHADVPAYAAEAIYARSILCCRGRTGCEFSVASLLLVWTQGKGHRVIRRGCGQQQAAHVVAHRRSRRRLSARVCGPARPETPTLSPSMFSFSCHGVPRWPNLATRSWVQPEGERGKQTLAAFPGIGATGPSGGIACGCQTARGVDTRSPQSLRTSAHL